MGEVILIGPWQHLRCVLDGMWPAAYRIQQAQLRFIRGTRWAREGLCMGDERRGIKVSPVFLGGWKGTVLWYGTLCRSWNVY